jgi:hypothetical protein
LEQNAGLEELARSDVRGEADRARAILLTLAGWTGVEVAEAFGVTADSVRHWPQWFNEGGVEALRSTLAPGPSPEKGERALAVASMQQLRDMEAAVKAAPDQQISLTDPDARSMATSGRGTGIVGYNVSCRACSPL